MRCRRDVMSKWKESIEKFLVEIISILIMYFVVLSVAGTLMAIVVGLIKLLR